MSAELAKDLEASLRPTFLLVYTHHHDDFIPAHPDELLDGSDTSPREFREEDHPFDIVVFQLCEHHGCSIALAFEC